MPPKAKKGSASTKEVPKKAARKMVSDTPRYGTDFVKIQVGAAEKRQEFAAHKDLLSAHSEFFRAAFSNGWKEGQEKKVVLEQQEPEIMRLFQHFLYSGEVYSSKVGDRISTEAYGNRWQDLEWSRLTRAWIFGDTILSTSLKDAVVDAIVHKVIESQSCSLSMHKDISYMSIPKAKI